LTLQPTKRAHQHVLASAPVDSGSARSAAEERVATAPAVGQRAPVTDEQRLQEMIDQLRRMREHCEPKSNQNPRYLRYSNAISALRWIIDDLAPERS
jgi:hypothetical protein